MRPGPEPAADSILRVRAAVAGVKQAFPDRAAGGATMAERRCAEGWTGAKWRTGSPANAGDPVAMLRSFESDESGGIV